jgi:hypothetical protein
MQNTETPTTDFLTQLGTVDDVKAQAQSGVGLSERFEFNTHIHLPPNFSAFQTVRQAVELAAEQGVSVLGVGNYYDFSIYREFAKAAGQKNIFPLFGTEIIALETDLQQKGIRVNDPDNPGKYYICGKGISRFDRFSPRAADVLSQIRENDALRMRKMTAKMADVFGFAGIDDRAVIARIVKRYGCAAETVTLQERHLAQVFQEVFFETIPAPQREQKLAHIFGCTPQAALSDAVGIQNEIRSRLMKAGKSCFVPETFVNLSQAKELIAELGGIPCYPVLADGAKRRCEYETPLSEFIQTLKNNHYAMVELIPVRNQPDVLAEYVTAIRQAGIAVVAGTEHNTQDLLPIKPTCIKGQDIPEDVKAIFREGVCVLAAHAFLKSHRQDGFMGTTYGSPEEKICAFSKIGAVVLQRYFKKQKTS